MAPLNTHLIIGERVFADLAHVPTHTYGAFLLGCLLPDVNNFVNIDRRVTHFVGRLHEDGTDAFTKSCDNFLRRRETLLRHPWATLTRDERAFVAGYVCHLAADETWKAWGMEIMRTLDISSLDQLPVPGDVVLTVFSVLSHPLYRDFDGVRTTLMATSVPDVFTHVLMDDFKYMMTAIRSAMTYMDSPESYYKMLAYAGMPPEALRTVKAKHTTFWDAGIQFIQVQGGVASYIERAVYHALDVLSNLRVTGK